MSAVVAQELTSSPAIPDEWVWQTLGELTSRISDGIHATPKYVESSAFHFINGNNLGNGSITFSESTKCVSEDEYWYHKQDLGSSTILMSINGTIGNLAFYTGEDVVLGKSAAYLNLKLDVDKTYVFYQLQSLEVVTHFDDELTGTTIRNLSLEAIRNTSIRLPKLTKEQRAIAQALSDVDALINAIDALITKKRLIKQGTMQQLLTGKTRLPGFVGPTAYLQTEVGELPEDWDVKQLGEIFAITSSTRVFQNEWKEEGVPFYRARELAILGETGSVDNELFITQTMYDTYRRLHGVPEVGDMLVTGVGTLGKAFVVADERPFYFKDGNIIWFKISGAVNSEFLKHLYLTPVIIKQIFDASAGTTVGTYTITGAKKTVIPFPTLDEQAAIAEVLDDMESEITALEQKRDKTKLIKHGMMQELLTGKTRLV